MVAAGGPGLTSSDRADGRFEPVCFRAGYRRGLTVHRGAVLVGSSRCRDVRAGAFAGPR